jgi:hypothetical protein
MVVLEETAPLGAAFPPSSHIPGTMADKQGGLRTCAPRAKALGYSARPFHGSKPAAVHQPPITDIDYFARPSGVPNTGINLGGRFPRNRAPAIGT